MMRTIINKRLVSGLATALFAGVLSSYVMAASVPYEYERRDKDLEHKRYLRKLTDDHRKADSAIANTKLLIDKSKDRPYLPELYLRLAELYIEKSRIVFYLNQDQKAREDSNKTSSLDQFESTLLKNKAVEIYQRILDQFPIYEARDKVHFFLAHEYRELQRIDDMTKHYRAIVKEHPESLYAAESYLLLGDYFMGKQDPETAKHHYESVFKHEENPAVPIARYKLAWCFVNRNDFQKAISLFETSVKSVAGSGNVDIDTYRRVDVRLESLIDMAYCYPEVYKNSTPEQALAYFESYSWSRQTYSIVLEKLASRYYAKKKWKQAAPIYRKLAKLRQDPEKLLEYIGRIFECAQAVNDFESADTDVALIVKALKSQQASIHIAKQEKEKNIEAYERYARHLTTHLHESARKGKSAASFERAADAYECYLDFFSDSPAIDEMTANYAESLFACRRYLAAGKQYERLIIQEGLSAKEKREIHYSAVSSYYQSLKNKDALNYYQTAYARSGLRTVGRQYAAAYPSSIHTPDVLFNVAWVAYDAGKLDDAISDFSKFINRYPNVKATPAAVHLTLDAYHQKEDYKGLILFGRRILARGNIRSAELRAEISEIVAGGESKIVSNLTLAAVEDWETGKTKLMETAKKSKSSGLGKQALATLVISSREKDDFATFFDAGNRLVTRFPKSDASKDALERMIDTALNMGNFRMLADYLETFSKQFSTDKNAAEFLLQAAKIHENLNDHKAAGRNYRRLLSFKGLNKNQRDDIIFGLVESEQKLGDPSGALKVLSTYYQTLSNNKRVHGDAKRALLSFENNDFSQAYTYLNRARKHFSSAMGKRDSQLAADMARAVYRETVFKDRVYNRLNFSGQIDNQIVAQKTRLLKDLEARYQNIIAYQSPIWALKACMGMADANREYARFLKEAPLPEMNDAEKAQYLTLIAQKAEAYTKKADQLRQTALRLARKWELCDSEAARAYQGAAQTAGDIASFSASRKSRVFSDQWLTDKTLYDLHLNLLENPEAPAAMVTLSQAYLQKGDYLHAGVIAKNALANIEAGIEASRADLYTILGVIHLYENEDDRARNAFKRALQSSSDHVAALINLAGLYFHYGHKGKARRIYAEISGANVSEPNREMIHPHAKELYHAR